MFTAEQRLENNLTLMPTVTYQLSSFPQSGDQPPDEKVSLLLEGSANTRASYFLPEYGPPSLPSSQ